MYILIHVQRRDPSSPTNLLDKGSIDLHKANHSNVAQNDLVIRSFCFLIISLKSEHPILCRPNHSKYLVLFKSLIGLFIRTNKRFNKSQYFQGCSRCEVGITVCKIHVALTIDIDATALLLHVASVNLAHVAPLVGYLDAADVELPHAVLLVRTHPYPRVVRYHTLVQREDRLRVRLYPPDLHEPCLINVNIRRLCDAAQRQQCSQSERRRRWAVEGLRT